MLRLYVRDLAGRILCKDRMKTQWVSDVHYFRLVSRILIDNTTCDSVVST